MRFLLLTTLLACGGDISIIARQDEKTNDTQEQVVAVEDTETPSDPPSDPSSEPESQMTDLSVGLATIHFRQISCPACMGVYDEFDITAELRMHQPTSGDYFEYMTPAGSCTNNLMESYIGAQQLKRRCLTALRLIRQDKERGSITIFTNTRFRDRHPIPLLLKTAR